MSDKGKNIPIIIVGALAATAVVAWFLTRSASADSSIHVPQGIVEVQVPAGWATTASAICTRYPEITSIAWLVESNPVWSPAYVCDISPPSVDFDIISAPELWLMISATAPVIITP